MRKPPISGSHGCLPFVGKRADDPFAEELFFVVLGNKSEPAVPIPELAFGAAARLLRVVNLAREHVARADVIVSRDEVHRLRPSRSIAET